MRRQVLVVTGLAAVIMVGIVSVQIVRDVPALAVAIVGSACAVLAHSLIRRFFVACVAAAAGASCLMATIGCIRDRYFDGWLIIALAVIAAGAFPVAMAVGLPFAVFRWKTGARQPASGSSDW